MSEPIQINLKSKIKWISISIILVTLLALWPALVETTYAGYFKVKQAAITGKMTAYTEPGMFPQLLGTITEFQEAGTVWFSKLKEEGGRGTIVGPISVRFNDGGTAKVSGNVRYTLAKNLEYLINIKKKFRTDKNLQHKGIQQVVKGAIILTAALMNSEQSYTARAQFSEMARDQIENGVYLTETAVITETDELSGDKKEKRIVVIKRGSNREPLRKPHPLKQYGVTFSQCVIKDIDYEKGVLALIQKKREYLMRIAAKRAEAENAVQERKTAEEVGKRNVTEKEYATLVLKKEAVIKAQRDKEVAELQAAKELEVAKLDRQAAEQEKLANILRGQGEAERKRLVLEADGALEKKLATYEKVHEVWANAFANRKVPQWSMGASTTGSNTEVTDFYAMLGLLIAKDLGLDLTVPKGAKVQNK
jgi:regulator of protease activity HflC (stomatin/prohibitin superfamily)